ncbi:MAG: hypothetical protein ACE5ID_02920, partial [Acidobacteriota bacterium]
VGSETTTRIRNAMNDQPAFARRPGRVWVLAERDSLEAIQGTLPLQVVVGDENPQGGYVLLKGGRP